MRRVWGAFMVVLASCVGLRVPARDAAGEVADVDAAEVDAGPAEAGVMDVADVMDALDVDAADVDAADVDAADVDAADVDAADVDATDVDAADVDAADVDAADVDAADVDAADVDAADVTTLSEVPEAPDVTDEPDEGDAFDVGDATDVFSPDRLAGDVVVAALAAGWAHTCARMTDGTVRCWGTNTNGQLGDGRRGVDAGRLDAAPVMLATGMQFTEATDLASGERASCATVDGGVWCWGAGAVVASDVPFYPAHRAFDGGVMAIALGDDQACAVLSDGVHCWGEPSSVVLPNPSATAVPGTRGATAVVAGSVHACAIVAGGVVHCWGDNSALQLGRPVGGDGGVDHSAAAVRLADSGVLHDATAISAGLEFTCAVVAGTVWCWGAGADGRLRPGSAANSGTPLQVPGITGATAVTCGTEFACALADRGVSCWGGGLTRLGLMPTTESVTVLGDGPYRSVVAGARHLCGLRTDGRVECRGVLSTNHSNDGNPPEVPERGLTLIPNLP